MLANLARNPWAFRHFSLSLRDDFDIAKNAIGKNAGLRYLSERLRDNEELVRYSMKQCNSDFQYASERLRQDKALVLH